MEAGLLRGIMTVIWLVLFLGIAWWAYSPSRKKRFDEAARLALDEPKEDAGRATTTSKKEQ